MSIITLTTDWGTKDHYLASVKGRLLTEIKNVQIIDISHEILPFDIYQASFIFKNCYENFPDGTIHIIGINSDAAIKQPHICIFYKNQYFIGADNGFFSLVFEQKPIEIIELEIYQNSNKFTFSVRDVFIKVAKLITEGAQTESLGKKISAINKMMSFEPVIEKDENQITIIGKVVYINRHQNAITNISESIFNEYAKNYNFDITFNSFSGELTNISKSYLDVQPSEMCAIFDSNNMLEISINQGNAGDLLGLKVDTRIRINIYK